MALISCNVCMKLVIEILCAFTIHLRSSANVCKLQDLTETLRSHRKNEDLHHKFRDLIFMFRIS
jgi:hypothetical protein